LEHLFFRTYCKPCEHDKDEKRKVRIEQFKQKYKVQGLSTHHFFSKTSILFWSAAMEKV
jgi:hypothetical protein